MFELSSHCIRDLVDVFTFEPNTNVLRHAKTTLFTF